MATTTLNTRIALKIDTTENWTSSTLVLLKGESAYEITESGDVKMKVGDGVKTFAELGYVTMTPAEINSLVSSGAIQSVSIASGTNNGTIKLTVDGKTTDNIAVKGLGSAAYTATSAYATAAQGTLATNAVRKVAQGSANGTISVTTGTGAATDVAVKGLASAAYKTAGSAQGNVPVNGSALGTTANVPVVTNASGQLVPHASGALGSAAFKSVGTFATAAQGTKADAAMPKSGGTFTGTVTLAADPTAALQATTKQYVDNKISTSISASDAMVFKGTLGTNGVVTALPTTGVIVGDTYKVITQTSIPADNSYTTSAETAKVGDLIVAMTKDPKWIVVPSGDEIVTTVKYSTTTTNLTTDAKSGGITLGAASIKQVDGTVSATSENLPTSKAVASYVTWGNVSGKPSTFTPSSHTHTKSQITDFPTSMPASDVYDWAKAKTKPTYTKSEVGLGNVDNTADANKSVKYATSAGSATNMSGTAAFTTTEAYRHVWFSDSATETARCYNDALKYDPKSNKMTVNITGNAATASSVAWGNVTGKPSTYTPSSHTHAIANVTNLQSELDTRALSKVLATNADLNSCTTPGIYSVGGGNTITNKPSGVDAFGLIVTHNATGTYYTQILYVTDSAVPYRRCCNNGTWGAWSRDVLVNTWRGIQNNLTSDSTTDSLSAAQGKALKALVDGKAASSHTHSQYYDSSVSRDANTVLAAPNGSAGSATFRKLVAADIPSLTKSKISDFPAALKNPTSLIVKLNGGSTEGTNLFTYDGSGAKTINITPGSIGAATSGHTHNYAGASSAGGSANSAVKLATARSFSITGGAVASAVSFNGTANVALSVTSLNTDYLVNGSNTLVLSCGGAA